MKISIIFIYVSLRLLTDRFQSFLFDLQIERERADLSVQVIQLSERLEEAEGGAESQVSLRMNHCNETRNIIV